MNDLELLKAVRVEVLQRAALGQTGCGLSSMVSAVSPVQYAHSYSGHAQALANKRSRFTSGSLKTYRGKVQWCLARLAVTGLLYTRRTPERGVAPYEHGERDKGFRFRVTKDQAIEALGRLKIEVRSPPSLWGGSPFLTKSLQ